MSNCVKCGEQISEEQYNNFDGLCPTCKRAQMYGMGDIGKVQVEFLKEQTERYMSRKAKEQTKLMLVFGGSSLILIGIFMSIGNPDWETGFNWVGPTFIVIGTIILIIGIIILIIYPYKWFIVPEPVESA